MRRLFLFVTLAGAAAACGDNIAPIDGDDEVDAAPLIDAGPPDAEVPPDALFCPPRAMGAIGGPCVEDADCDSEPGAGDGACFKGINGPVVFPPEGYCMADDFSGTECATNDDCGADETCVDWLDYSPYKTCMPSCSCEGSACPANQACIDSFNGFALDQAVCTPADAAAQDGDPCAGFYECNEYSSCYNDALEFPGGDCRAYACTVGTNEGCHGGHCINQNDPPFSGTMCVDTCTSDAECRTAEGYECFDPDGAGAAQAYCRHPHVGDACEAATDCGLGAWECMAFPGGYCTVTGCPTPGSTADCSPGSICYDPLVGADPNYCTDRCPTIGVQSTCRSGYLCMDTDPGVPVTGGCVPAP